MLSVQALMDGILDYAGLFPPAKLDMVPTMRNYHAYREGADHWMLGRIVVPVSRFEEFEANAEGLLAESRDPVSDDCWVISALTVPVSDEGFQRDLEAIEAMTANGPETLGPQAPDSGRLVAGFDADVIALDTNPLDDRSVRRQIKRHNRNVLRRDVFPYIELCPIRERKGTQALTWVEPAIEQIPELGSLVSRIPSMQFIAIGDDSFLRP